MLPSARMPLALIALTVLCVVIASTIAPIAPASAAARCRASDASSEPEQMKPRAKQQLVWTAETVACLRIVCTTTCDVWRRRAPAR
eukprot:5086811-Prymnesium_polylepis.1